jgi:hypothetical protein
LKYFEFRSLLSTKGGDNSETEKVAGERGELGGRGRKCWEGGRRREFWKRQR